MNICCRCLSSACVLILKVTIISSNIYIFEFGGVTEESRQGHRDAQTFQFHTWPLVKYPHTQTHKHKDINLVNVVSHSPLHCFFPLLEVQSEVWIQHLSQRNFASELVSGTKWNNCWRNKKHNIWFLFTAWLLGAKTWHFEFFFWLIIKKNNECL